MRDKVSIKLNSKEIEHFISYSLTADIFTAGAGFSFTFPAGLVDVEEGDLIKVFVNDERELLGIIDSIDEDDSKESFNLTISGRDVLGLAVDGCIEEFKTFSNKTLEEIVNYIFKDVEILNRSEVEFESESAKFNVSKKNAKPEVGQKIIDFISRITTSKRLLLYAKANGNVAFGKIPTDPKEDFKIFRDSNGSFNNVIRANRRRDISGAFSEVRLYSQTSGGSNTKSVFKNKDFPFRKIFVGVFNEDEESAEEQARAIIENQKKDAHSLTYIVPGHSQNGKNWRIRKGVRVVDERFKITKTFLLASRTMIQASKESGQSTEIKLIEYANR